MSEPRANKRPHHKRQKHAGIASGFAAMGELLGAAAVEMGDALRVAADSLGGEVARQARFSPAQRLVRRARRRRTEWLVHRNGYIVTNAGVAILNGLLAAMSGEWLPWFIFPAVSWGILLAIHSTLYRQWLADNRQQLESAQAEVAILGEQPWAPNRDAAGQRSATVAADVHWDDLVYRCGEAVWAAEQLLSQPGPVSLSDEMTGLLREGLRHLQRLAAGASTLRDTMRAVVPGGVEGLSADLADLDSKIAETGDASLLEVYQQNRALLLARRGMLAELRAEHDRMLARAEGFLLAVQNIRLDASRMGVTSLGPERLTESLRRLGEEVEILREVERELRHSHGED